MALLDAAPLQDLWVCCDSCSKWRRLAPDTKIDSDASWCALVSIACAAVDDRGCSHASLPGHVSSCSCRPSRMQHGMRGSELQCVQPTSACRLHRRVRKVGTHALLPRCTVCTGTAGTTRTRIKRPAPFQKRCALRAFVLEVVQIRGMHTTSCAHPCRCCCSQKSQLRNPQGANALSARRWPFCGSLGVRCSRAHAREHASSPAARGTLCCCMTSWDSPVSVCIKALC